MFRYADEGTFISLRAFYDDRDGVFAITGHSVPADTRVLLPTIEAFANRCAAAATRVVCCPPIATFEGADRATEAGLLNGLALSVECDRKPAAARLRLEGLLGPATVVVESGGEWVDPETGEVHRKQHLHWRLSEPTRCQEDHQRLKQARVLATVLVGGDASNKPVVHPIRWPGSWHRKGLPRLTRIAHLTEAEIDLDEALERLLDAAEAAGCSTSSGTASGARAPGDGESRDTAELIRACADRHRLPRTTGSPRDALPARRHGRRSGGAHTARHHAGDPRSRARSEGRRPPARQVAGPVRWHSAGGFHSPGQVRGAGICRRRAGGSTG